MRVQLAGVEMRRSCSVFARARRQIHGNKFSTAASAKFDVDV